MSVTRTGPGVKPLVHGLTELDGLEAKVGWFESAHYADGTPVAYVATIQEFGVDAGPRNSKIPARPFMRPAVAKNGPEWMELLAQGAKRVADSGFSARDVLELVALKAAGDVGKAIQAVTFPRLSDYTIARKGHEKPLIDTGQMFQSVTGKVEAEGTGSQ